MGYKLVCGAWVLRHEREPFWSVKWCAYWIWIQCNHAERVCVDSLSLGVLTLTTGSSPAGFPLLDIDLQYLDFDPWWQPWWYLQQMMAPSSSLYGNIRGMQHRFDVWFKLVQKRQPLTSLMILPHSSGVFLTAQLAWAFQQACQLWNCLRTACLLVRLLGGVSWLA